MLYISIGYQSVACWTFLQCVSVGCCIFLRNVSQLGDVHFDRVFQQTVCIVFKIVCMCQPTVNKKFTECQLMVFIRLVCHKDLCLLGLEI